jgi:hypothetical protein
MAYLQYITQLLNNFPFLVLKLVLPHLAVSRNLVDGLAIFKSEYEHVVRRIPACAHITWHHSDGEGMKAARLVCKIFKQLHPARE